MIPKDHKGLYLAPPFNRCKQIKIVCSEKDVMDKHLWNLWSLSGGKIGKKPPIKVMKEWE